MILSYSIISSLILAFGYLTYRLLMAGLSQHEINRNALLTIYGISLIAPLVILPVMLFNSFGQPSTDMVNIGEITGGITATETDNGSAYCSDNSMKYIYDVFLIGTAVTAIYFLIGLLSLWRMIRRGEKTVFATFSLILVDDALKISPFGWGRSIVMTRKDYEEFGDLILIHEFAHLRNLHWIDLVIAYATICLQWYNPAAWAMREELKVLHEYQADEMVVNEGVDIKEYQMLLLKKAVGNGYQSLANNLNHSKLQNRVTMMYKKKTSLRRRMFALALIPAMGAGIAMTAIPSVAGVLKSFAETPVSIPSETISALPEETPKEREVFVAVQNQAEFPGGMKALMEWLYDHIVYPEKAEKDGIQGRVIIKFIIEADGSISNPEVIKGVSRELDKEAMRLVRSMPKWTPAQNGGKDVASYFTMPVNFKIMEDKKD